MNSLHQPPVVRYRPDVFGFPDRLRTRIRYSDIFSITSIAGVVGRQLYRWNSTFDPDFTNVGHQPLYRDTYATIYNSYAVISSTAHVRIMNVSTTAPFAIGCVTEDDSTTSTTVDTLVEMSHGVSKLLSPLAGSSSNTSFNLKWSCAHNLGIDPFTSQTYKTAVGSNPSEESYLVIWVATADASTASVTMQIVLEQEVLWTELQTPVQS